MLLLQLLATQLLPQCSLLSLQLQLLLLLLVATVGPWLEEHAFTHVLQYGTIQLDLCARGVEAKAK